MFLNIFFWVLKFIQFHLTITLFCLWLWDHERCTVLSLGLQEMYCDLCKFHHSLFICFPLLHHFYNSLLSDPLCIHQNHLSCTMMPLLKSTQCTHLSVFALCFDHYPTFLIRFCEDCMGWCCGRCCMDIRGALRGLEFLG